MANKSLNAVEPEVKTLANCKPSEFVKQTVAIKKAAESWMKATDIINIFRSPVNFKTASKDATPEERAEVIKENKKIQEDAGMERLSKLFTTALEENPEKTLELMALCCFVEPENVDEHPIKWYMKAISELLHDEDVLSFFTSVASLAR